MDNKQIANQPVHPRDFLWSQMDARGWHTINGLVAAMCRADPDVSEVRHLTAVQLFLDQQNTAELGYIAHRIGRALGWPDGEPLLKIEAAWQAWEAGP